MRYPQQFILTQTGEKEETTSEPVTEVILIGRPISAKPTQGGVGSRSRV